MPRLHICLPWVESCGRVLRVYLWIGPWGIAVALHRNATFSRILPNDTIATRWWIVLSRD